MASALENGVIASGELLYEWLLNLLVVDVLEIKLDRNLTWYIDLCVSMFTVLISESICFSAKILTYIFHSSNSKFD